MSDVVENTNELGKIYVNKLAAAERQLNAAIRMYFMEEDPLAIHCVGSSAYNLLGDLLAEQGKDESAFPLIYGILRAARDFRDGLLREEQVSAWGEGAMAFLMPYVDMLREHPDHDIENIRVSSPPDWAREFWRTRREVWNYLKHADKDADRLLDEGKVNNEDLILRAINASLHLNTPLSTEKEFFFFFLVARGRAKKPLKDPGDQSPLYYLLRAYTAKEAMVLARRNLCYARVDDDTEIDHEAAKRQSMELLEADLRGREDQ